MILDCPKPRIRKSRYSARGKFLKSTETDRADRPEGEYFRWGAILLATFLMACKKSSRGSGQRPVLVYIQYSHVSSEAPRLQGGAS